MGVGVVPTYPRHPAALAQQALTTATATNGRFILGIGPSHRPGMEEGFGIPYDRPALHTREYLSVMRPLLEDGAVQFSGEFFNVNLELAALERPACPILVSALAPQMLNLAGQLADGTVTWMAGPRTIETHITPRISRAADNAGRASPASPSACPRRSPTTKTPDAAPPPSPTPATASWSTTAAYWTSRAPKARRKSR